MELPAVTFIMAARNAAATIRSALDSIVAQDYKGQIFTIVVDDASSDETGSIAAEFSNVHVLRNDRQLGRSLSRNRAIDIASTPLIAIHDADDISMPSRLSACVPLIAGTEAKVVGSQIEWVDPDYGPYHVGLWPESSVECERKADMGRMPVAHPTMIVPTFLVRSVGGYDSRFPVGEDLDLILKIRSAFPQTQFINASVIGVEYRRPRMDSMRYSYSSAYWRERVLTEHGFSRDLIGSPWWIQASLNLAKQRIRLRVYTPQGEAARKSP